MSNRNLPIFRERAADHAADMLTAYNSPRTTPRRQRRVRSNSGLAGMMSPPGCSGISDIDENSLQLDFTQPLCHQSLHDLCYTGSTSYHSLPEDAYIRSTSCHSIPEDDGADVPLTRRLRRAKRRLLLKLAASELGTTSEHSTSSSSTDLHAVTAKTA